MKLEKVKTNHGIHIRGAYKNGTAYIANFIDMPEYEKIVDWIIKNYPKEKTNVEKHNNRLQNKRITR